MVVVKGDVNEEKEMIQSTSVEFCSKKKKAVEAQKKRLIRDSYLRVLDALCATFYGFHPSLQVCKLKHAISPLHGSNGTLLLSGFDWFRYEGFIYRCCYRRDMQ